MSIIKKGNSGRIKICFVGKNTGCHHITTYGICHYQWYFGVKVAIASAVILLLLLGLSGYHESRHGYMHLVD